MPAVIFLNPNKYMVPGTNNREREFSRTPVRNFSCEDSAMIASRTKAIADAYPALTRPARQVLLHPNIFPVFLGVKDSYIQYTDNPYTEQLCREVCAIPGIGQQFGLLFTNAYIINLLRFKQRISNDGDFLSAKGCMSPAQVDFFRDRLVDNTWVERLSPILSRFIKWSTERTYFHGFLTGYPIEDIEYAVRMENKGALSYATVISDLFGNNMLSDENPTAFALLKRWESDMRFGYAPLSHFPHFWDDLDVGLSDSLSLIRENLGRFTEMVVNVRINDTRPYQN